jgi:ATPase subunit of ABC transporter with duplicated ATPase domains
MEAPRSRSSCHSHGPAIYFPDAGPDQGLPGGKKIFENIWLSFYSDAKIGVGRASTASGKSTLLKIMAGLDATILGRGQGRRRHPRGYLLLQPQEPVLDPTWPAWTSGATSSPTAKTSEIFDRYNAIAMELGEEYTDELMEEMTKLQEIIDARDLWDIDSKVEMAMDALRCPPNDWASIARPVGR